MEAATAPFSSGKRKKRNPNNTNNNINRRRQGGQGKKEEAPLEENLYIYPLNPQTLSSSISILVCDAVEPDFPIIYVNKVFQLLTGYLASQVLGLNCRFLQYREGGGQRRHPLVDPGVVSDMRRCVGQGIEFHGQLLNFRKDGAPLLNILRLSPILADDGAITHFIAFQTFFLLKADLNHISYPVFNENQPRQACPILMLSDEVLSHNILSRLSPRDLASIGSVCRRIRQLGNNEHVRKMACERRWGREVTRALEPIVNKRRIGWGRLAREFTTLEAASWRRLTVGGAVEPSRCNFSACAVGNRLVLFGGKGVNMQPMDDTFVLNLEAENPEWRRMSVVSSPPARWGHTLSSLNSSRLVVFGGYGLKGLLNDVFVLDLDAENPTWSEVFGGIPPLPRTWHSSCTLEGSKLVVSGGCTGKGLLLSDTYLLDLDKPVWREVTSSTLGGAMPARLGHSLSAYGRQKLLMFGGLAESGNLKIQSKDAYTIDLGKERPRWRQLEEEEAAAALGNGPPARMDHVTVSMPCGRVIVFGGSVAGMNSPCQVFIIDPLEEKPRWRVVKVAGEQPKFAWGHGTCMVGGTRVLVLGGHAGEEWIVNELHELCFVASREESNT